MYRDQIPRSAPQNMLAGLKLGGLVQLRQNDFSQGKDFIVRKLQKGTVGRVLRIYDYGRNFKEHRFLIDVHISGHPITNFWSEELTKVTVR